MRLLGCASGNHGDVFRGRAAKRDRASPDALHKHQLSTRASRRSAGRPADAIHGVRQVNTVLAHFTERLEAVRPDGTDDFMLSTGGDAIADDLAAVLSFALNATFTPIRGKADRLISQPTGSHHHPRPADILPHTFGANLMVRDDDITDLQDFMSALLALNRVAYEAAMRAIRRIVTASERVADDPTLAYTDYVAALESLSAGFNVATPTWDRLDPRKRRILDPALSGLSAGDAERVRAAILGSERAGIKNRYVEFVLDHIRPAFYREEATGLNRPAQRASLRHLVAKAYDARSKSLHELRELSIGTWLLVGGAQTVTPPGESLMLTLEGLNTVARHVVRTYVQRAPTDKDTEYQWRENLPNVIQVQLAPELYLGSGDAMHSTTAATRAGEFLAHTIEVLSGRSDFKIDMRPALTGSSSCLSLSAHLVSANLCLPCICCGIASFGQSSTSQRPRRQLKRPRTSFNARACIRSRLPCCSTWSLSGT